MIEPTRYLVAAVKGFFSVPLIYGFDSEAWAVEHQPTLAYAHLPLAARRFLLLKLGQHLLQRFAASLPRLQIEQDRDDGDQWRGQNLREDRQSAQQLGSEIGILLEHTDGVFPEDQLN